MSREKALEILLVTIDAQMKFTKQNMEEHPGLGYGELYDNLWNAKQYLETHLT